MIRRFPPIKDNFRESGHAGLRHADDAEMRGLEKKVGFEILSAFLRELPASVLPRSVFF